MTALAVAAAGVAGLLHVAIFAAEAIGWRRRAVWRAFGASSQEDAESKRVTMLNLGFYNLFLGLGALVGAGLYAADRPAGETLLLYSCAFMAAAGAVLVIGWRGGWRGALAQGVPPLVAIAAVLAG